MNKFDLNEDEREDEEKARAHAGVHRLLDILTQEVSIVNRAANKREWLIMKGDEMDKELLDAGDGTLTTAEPEQTIEKAMTKKVKAELLSGIKATVKRAEKFLSALKAATESDEAKSVPAAVVAEAKAISGLALGAIGKAQKSDESDEVEKAWTLPMGVRDQLSMVLTSAIETLQSILANVEASEETTDEEGGAIPPPMTAEVERVATALTSAVSGYAAKSDDQEAAEATEPDTGEELEVSDIDKAKERTKKASPFAVIKEAHSTLGMIMAKLKPGQPVDEDSYQRLERLRALIASIQSGKSSESEETEKSDDTIEAQDQTVEKAGAKMAAEKRKRFQTALKALIDLFKEVMPASELEKMPHLQVHKSDNSAEISELREKLEKAEGSLKGAIKEIAALKDRPGDSAAAVIEAHSAPKKTRVAWPIDLNAEE